MSREYGSSQKVRHQHERNNNGHEEGKATEHGDRCGSGEGRVPNRTRSSATFGLRLFGVLRRDRVERVLLRGPHAEIERRQRMLRGIRVRRGMLRRKRNLRMLWGRVAHRVGWFYRDRSCPAGAPSPEEYAPGAAV